MASSKNAAAAKALIDFLCTAEAKTAFRAKGLEPS
jgi:ABC-type Fe3+ transport system substrate-binding protein